MPSECVLSVEKAKIRSIDLRLTLGSGDMNICDECVDLYREHIEKEAGKPATMEKLVQVCNSCGTRPPASHRYCYNCGTQLLQN